MFNKLSFSICKKCNTVQLDDLIPIDVLYSKSHNIVSVGNTWEKYFKLFINKIETILDKQDNVLEIGCPSGKIATRIDKYKEWYLVDPNVQILPNNKIIPIQKFFDESFEINKKIDLIVHSHFFEHLYNPNEFIKKCHDVLIDNGKMIFSVPNIEYLLINSLFCLSFEHTIFFNKENITYLLNKNGFEIIEILDYENHSTIYHTRKINKNFENSLKITNYYDKFISLFKYYDDFADKCNYIINSNKNKNKNIFIFGASYTSQILLSKINKSGLKGILDNCKEKQNNFLYGSELPIYTPDILKKDDIVILKNGYYSNEIFKQLQRFECIIIQ
jgi:predicted SAM-dependent methyltransferase